MIIVIDLNSKLMKIILIPILMFLSIQSYAVEFYQCIDGKGQPHYSNLPAESFDSNCKQKSDRYDYLLKQDYSNLENKFNNYTESVIDQEQTDGSLLTIENFIDPVKDILDPDKALDQLLESSTNRDENMATEFFNARTNAIESVLSQEKTR